MGLGLFSGGIGTHSQAISVSVKKKVFQHYKIMDSSHSDFQMFGDINSSLEIVLNKYYFHCYFQSHIQSNNCLRQIILLWEQNIEICEQIINKTHIFPP